MQKKHEEIKIGDYVIGKGTAKVEKVTDTYISAVIVEHPDKSMIGFSFSQPKSHFEKVIKSESKQESQVKFERVVPKKELAKDLSKAIIKDTSRTIFQMVSNLKKKLQKR